MDKLRFDLSELTYFTDKLQNKLVKEWVGRACEDYALELEALVVDEIDNLKLNVSGDMRKSITHHVLNMMIEWIIEVGTNLKTAAGYPYPVGVHEGTRPHWAPIAPIQRWVQLKMNISNPKELKSIARRIQISISKRGTKAHPFMQNVFDKERPHFQEKIGRALAQAMAGGLIVQ